jgi:hypothetical protein
MAKTVKNPQEQESSVLQILNDKTIKLKGKMILISRLLLDDKITIAEWIETTRSQKGSSKATLIEAIETATKTKPVIIDAKAFEFVSECLAEKLPRVQWESARVIGNTAHLFPKQLKKAVPKLLDNSESESTVVRWSAAFALSQIIQCNTSLNQELIPAVESILKRENDNAVKKIYLQALKKAGVNK